MTTNTVIRAARRGARFALMLCLVPLAAAADPPSWAPAHGWRAQHERHERYYTGYTGTRWETDYGVASGRCDREAVGAVLGGVIGAAVGSQAAGGDNRQVATIVGGIMGAAVGAQIGRDLDSADRGCMAQALELAHDDQRVGWTDGGVRYVLTPTRDFTESQRACRAYTLEAIADGRARTVRRHACRIGTGVWRSEPR